MSDPDDESVLEFWINSLRAVHESDGMFPELFEEDHGEDEGLLPDKAVE